MSVRCKWAFIFLAVIVGLGISCGPAAAVSDEAFLRSFGQKWSEATTVEQRIELMEKRIAIKKRMLQEKQEYMSLIFGIVVHGYADLERAKEAYGKADAEEENLEDEIKRDEKYLKHLKTVRDAQYKAAKEKELKNVALARERARIVEKHREARVARSITLARVVMYMHTMAIISGAMFNNHMASVALAYRISQSIAAAQRGSESGRCFVAGTLVLMADGSFKPIEQVAVGDTVFSRDGPDGEFVTAEVYKILRGAEKYVYAFDDGLRVNADHNFYTNQGPVMACALTPGMTLLGRDSSRVLASIQKQGPTLASTNEKIPGIPVYNIMVRGTHTFFVSPDGKNTYMVLDISACGK